MSYRKRMQPAAPGRAPSTAAPGHSTILAEVVGQDPLAFRLAFRLANVTNGRLRGLGLVHRPGPGPSIPALLAQVPEDLVDHRRRLDQRDHAHRAAAAAWGARSPRVRLA